MKKYSKHFFIWMVAITIVFVVAVVIANSLIGSSIEQISAKYTAQMLAQSGENSAQMTQLYKTVHTELQEDLFIKSTVLLFVLLLFIVIASVRFYLLNKDYERINLYESILHAVGKPLFSTDLDKNITFMNKPALEMLGIDEERALGSQCSSLFNVELCNTKRCAIECLKSGSPSCSFMLGNRTFFTKAFDLTNTTGHKTGFIEVITDTTEEVKLHQELVEKAEWYESILNCVTNPLSVTDMDMNITFLNNAGLTVLGKTAEEVKGKRCGDVWGVAICKDERCGINCLRNGRGQSIFNVGDLVMTTDAQYLKNGKGEVVGHIEVVGDITDSSSRLEYTRNAVTTLTAGIKRMADGDLTNIDLTMEQPSQYTQHTYAGFNTIAENIGTLKEHLVSLISQLQRAIQTTAVSSSEIASTADSLAAATQEQSAQTDEVATAMEEMSRTVADNASSAARTAEVAKQTEHVASSGGKVVEQTVAKMKEIALVVKTSAENIVKLGESSKRIGEIISVIDDIADQTNLLSLNAAIEAARAGEQGRGFAVVADSVGKLAVSTASATKEIADMIKGIQADTDVAVKAMEKGTLEVQSGIELADNAGRSIQDILRSINELLGMVEHIAAASEQQSATSEEISNNVSSISKVTAESARNIETVATTASNLTQMTDTLNTLALQFKIEDNNGHHRRLA